MGNSSPSLGEPEPHFEASVKLWGQKNIVGSIQSLYFGARQLRKVHGEIAQKMHTFLNEHVTNGCSPMHAPFIQKIRNLIEDCLRVCATTETSHD